jgi:hypothetical protein
MASVAGAVLGDEPTEMPLVSDDDMVEALAAHAAAQRSATPFCHKLRGRTDRRRLADPRGGDPPIARPRLAWTSGAFDHGHA